MPSADLDLNGLYQKLAALLGPSGWWPAQSRYEILVGAILVQNTNWRNVDKSLDNLRAATNFQPEKIAHLSQLDLIAMIRPSGFYKNKSKALLALFKWLDGRPLDTIGQIPPVTLRRQLLALPGIGQETADAMRLFVFDQATFIADLYARRLFSWLGQPYQTYSQLAKHTKSAASWPLADAQEFHGLIDNFGKGVKTKADFDASALAGCKLRLD